MKRRCLAVTLLMAVLLCACASSKEQPENGENNSEVVESVVDGEDVKAENEDVQMEEIFGNVIGMTI